MNDDEVHIVQVTGHNYRADILAYAMVAFFGYTIYMLLTHSVPEGPTRDTLLLMIGALLGLVKDVYGFEFGSSQTDKSGDTKAALRQLAGAPSTVPEEHTETKKVEQ